MRSEMLSMRPTIHGRPALRICRHSHWSLTVEYPHTTQIICHFELKLPQIGDYLNCVSFCSHLDIPKHLDYLFPTGTVFCLPTTPFPAPRKNLPQREQNTIREQILCLCAHGGLTGFPRLNIAGATVDGALVGFSIIGGRGTDASLVAAAIAMERV